MAGGRACGRTFGPQLSAVRRCSKRERGLAADEGGALGTILVGVFAGVAVNHLSGSIEGNIHQFLIQVSGVGIAIAHSFVLPYVLPRLVNLVTPERVSEQIEVAGLDNGLFGEEAYVE